MTKARIQPICKAKKINLGYFDREKVFPRSVTDRNNALYLYNDQFCLIWKVEGVSFNQAIKELKDNFKIVDNYITEKKPLILILNTYINEINFNHIWLISMYMI